MYEPHCALTEAQLATVAEAIARLSSAFLNDVNAQIDWVLQPAVALFADSNVSRPPIPI